MNKYQITHLGSRVLKMPMGTTLETISNPNRRLWKQIEPASKMVATAPSMYILLVDLIKSGIGNIVLKEKAIQLVKQATE